MRQYLGPVCCWTAVCSKELITALQMSRWLATMDSCTSMGCSNIHSTPCRLIVVLLIINGSVFRLNKTNIVFPDHFLCKGYPLQRKFQLTIRQPQIGRRSGITQVYFRYKLAIT